MTWVSHRLVTFSGVFCLTGNVFYAVAAMCGSVFPDRVELLYYGGFSPQYHRRFFHWFVLYLVPVLLLLFYDLSFLDNLFVYYFSSFFLWFFIGSLCHIIEDALCGKIPFLVPTRKVSVFPKVFSVASLGEFAFVLLWFLVLFVMKLTAVFVSLA